VGRPYLAGPQSDDGRRLVLENQHVMNITSGGLEYTPGLR
jgi:hypothetical protein